MKNKLHNIKDFIFKHKKGAILCSILCIIMIILIILFFGGGKESLESIEDKVKNKAKYQAQAYTMLSYDTSNTSAIVTTIRKNDANEYEVYGKITARDKYGDSFSGTFDGVCTYEDDEHIPCDLDYSKMFKD